MSGHAARALLSLVLAGAGESRPAPFVERPSLAFQHRSGSPEKAYILETMGSGVALFDYDGDSDLDIYLVDAGSISSAGGAANRLFRNEGGWRFRDVTAESGLGDTGFGQGVAVGDIDNDGNPDVYVTNHGPNALYRNRGDGTFVKESSGAEGDRWSASAAFGDVDGDGRVDLYVAHYLEFDRELLDRLIPRRFCEWKGLRVNCGPRGFPHVSGSLFRNRGDFTFEDVTAAAGVERFDAYQLGVVFSDLDLDSDLDLYVATDSTPNLLFENRGDGTFGDRSLLSGAAFSHLGAEQAGMGVDSGDVDGDGMPDLFVTNFSDDYNTLYLNRGDLSFLDATDLAGLAVASLPYLGWSTFLEDFDSDGDLDVFLVNGHVYPQVDGGEVGESFRQPMQFFWNDGKGRFSEASGDVLSVPRSARGAALGDLDGDSDSDVVVNVMDGSPVLLESRAAAPVSLRLVGRTSNRDGIGAQVWAELEGRRILREVRSTRGYLSASEPTARIGLGSASEAERIVVEWPNGVRDVVENVGSGSYILLEGSNRLFRLD